MRLPVSELESPKLMIVGYFRVMDRDEGKKEMKMKVKRTSERLFTMGAIGLEINSRAICNEANDVNGSYIR